MLGVSVGLSTSNSQLIPCSPGCSPVPHLPLPGPDMHLPRPPAPPPHFPSASLPQLLRWPLAATLAAFDTLAGFVHLLPLIRRAGSPIAGLEVVRGLCRYIVLQVYQPPGRGQTRSLHTMIVAA